LYVLSTIRKFDARSLYKFRIARDPPAIRSKLQTALSQASSDCYTLWTRQTAKRTCLSKSHAAEQVLKAWVVTQRIKVGVHLEELQNV